MRKNIDKLIKSLRFDGLTYTYDDGVHALFEDVSFEFPMDSVVWIHAPGGEGRSSLMQLLAGLLMPTAGKYFINDENVADMSFEEFLPYRLKIGYGFDFGGLINNRTIYENLVLPLKYHRVISEKEAEARVLEVMKFMGLMRYKDQRPAVVPGGVRKLACMIRPLIMYPEVLLLDDPSVGLSEETVLKYFDLVKMVRERGALQHMYISSYDGRLLRILGAREVIINDGKLYLNDLEEKMPVSG